LNDLAFVKSNRALKHRCKDSVFRDPILLKEIDDSNEWLLRRMEDDSDDDLVIEGNILTGEVVAQVVVPMSIAIALSVEQVLVPLKFQQETNEKLSLMPLVLNLMELLFN